ncbi:hypothetical protein V7S43_003901 [Phytophthora oleae]|uniref:Uncharacterized protein n=1 Tax=Phytophthora oleae TaxID=2107226 RepID=A0ABD3FUX6_9STRA
MFGHIIETNEIFDVSCDRETTVRDLLGKVIVHKDWDCSVDELNLYFARKNGQPLLESEPECFDLSQGKLSDGLRKIMSEANRIDPDTLVQTLITTCDTYLLLKAPPRILRKHKYRKSVAATRRSLIESGHLAAENADLESFDEVCWWERLSSYILPPKMDLEKKNL